MHRETILKTAAQLTCEDRNKQYGEPEINLKLAALLKSAFWNGATRDISPAEHEAIDMVLTKLSRIGTGTYKEDNYIDAAAYIAIAGQMGARHNITPGQTLDPSKLEDTPIPIQHPMTFGRHACFCPIPGREKDFDTLMLFHKRAQYGNVSYGELSVKEFGTILELATKDLHAPIDDKHPLRRHAIRTQPKITEEEYEIFQKVAKPFFTTEADRS